MRVKDMNWDGKGTKAYRFYCEGCKSHHAPVEGRWTFNENYENPTFSPSILVHATEMTEKGIADYEAWCKLGYPNRDESFESVQIVCHSFVTDGKIQYLSDCTHALAGQTIDLTPID
jgi:hypothetical protein